MIQLLYIVGPCYIYGVLSTITGTEDDERGKGEVIFYCSMGNGMSSHSRTSPLRSITITIAYFFNAIKTTRRLTRQ